MGAEVRSRAFFPTQRAFAHRLRPFLLAELHACQLSLVLIALQMGTFPVQAHRTTTTASPPSFFVFSPIEPDFHLRD